MKNLTSTFVILLISISGFCQSISCGMWYDSINVFHFASVNMLTGQMIFNNPVPSIQGVVGETSVLNLSTNQYIFKGNYPSSRYFTIDIATGTIVNDTLAPDNIMMLQINPSTGIVYGLWFDSLSTCHFVSVNTQTGQKTVLDTLNNVQVVVGETAVLNPLSNQYIFKGNYPSSRYFTIDITTGAIINDTLAPDNIMMLEYYSTLSSINENERFLNYKIYPNPFNQYATIEFENPKNEKFNLSVYNSSGQLLFSINNITTGQIKIEKNLTIGLYFFQLLTGRQVVATGKFIIE